MLILDTNHYTEIEKQSRSGLSLIQRLRDAGGEGFLTIITPEEVLKGWMAAIRDRRQTDRGVRAYREFQDSLKGFNEWVILPWSYEAADIFDDFRRQKGEHRHHGPPRRLHRPRIWRDGAHAEPRRFREGAGLAGGELAGLISSQTNRKKNITCPPAGRRAPGRRRFPGGSWDEPRCGRRRGGFLAVGR